MKIIKKGTMPDETSIQIEDWSENYSFHNYADTLASYPISKATHSGTYAPKAGESYRFSFRFGSFEEAEQAFNDLLKGDKDLSDFKHLMNRLEYRNCI